MKSISLFRISAPKHFSAVLSGGLLKRRFPALLGLVLCAFAFSADLRVTNVIPLTEPGEGGRLSWSWERDLVAFDRVGLDDFFDVWVMNPDGSNQRCLTCNATELSPRNHGNPAWHPSGDYMVFQVQKDVPVGPMGDTFARPGVGVNNDIWIMDANGTQFWQVTDVPARLGGVLHPHFSDDGTQLTWAERFDVDPLPSGEWRIHVADVSFPNGAPVVTNVRTLRPGEFGNLYETHGFSRDGQRVLFAANLEPNQTENGIDIYTYDLERQNLVNLTGTLDEWDEHARPSPQGDRILWMSSMGAPRVFGALRTEYWLMDPDGSDQYQLTWFNDERGPNFIPGGIVAGDSDWSEDGTRLMAYLIEGGEGLGGLGRIAVIEFEEAATAVLAATFERGRIAPASLVSIFGDNLARELLAAETVPLPTSLGGTSVSVRDANGVERPALLHSVSPQQVNVILPDASASGPGVLTVTNHLGERTRATVLIEDVAPGVFTANQSGSGAPAAIIQRVAPDGSQSSEFTFECPGDVTSCMPRRLEFGDDRLFLSLFTTGVRNRRSLFSVDVLIGSIRGPVSFAGTQSEFPGLDQVVVELPRSLAGAGLVDVVLRVEGVQANVVQLRF